MSQQKERIFFCLPSINFQVAMRYVSFREGKYLDNSSIHTSRLYRSHSSGQIAGFPHLFFTGLCWQMMLLGCPWKLVTIVSKLVYRTYNPLLWAL